MNGAALFFYGLVTFSRYLGVFADKGWAWNCAGNSSNNFSFEMIECIILFSYGVAQNWIGFFMQVDSDGAGTYDGLSFV